MNSDSREARRRAASGLGDRIAARRKALGLTQAEVRDRLVDQGVSISSASVSAWEWGRPRIALDQVVALAVALECSVTYLLGLTAKPEKWTPDS